jgi:hypothetical protein
MLRHIHANIVFAAAGCGGLAAGFPEPAEHRAEHGGVALSTVLKLS